MLSLYNNNDLFMFPFILETSYYSHYLILGIFIGLAIFNNPNWFTEFVLYATYNKFYLLYVFLSIFFTVFFLFNVFVVLFAKETFEIVESTLYFYIFLI